MTFFKLFKRGVEVFLPLADFVVQFLIPGVLLAFLHVGFIREPEIDMGPLTRQ